MCPINITHKQMVCLNYFVFTSNAEAMRYHENQYELLNFNLCVVLLLNCMHNTVSITNLL